MARALKGVRAYQEAPRSDPLPLMPVIAEAHGAMLRDYGGEGPPVLFVPSLINPPNILDLSKEKSLLRWLAAKGHRVLLIDWGWNSQARRSMNIADHVERILLPLIREIGEPLALVGYCLGGTVALAAAQFANVRSLATIAAPWHFSGFSTEARHMLTTLWESSRATATAIGVLPMEVLQAAFWSLDPARTVAKFEKFAELDPRSEEAASFVTLEDWSNDGPPLPEAAAREMFDSFFRDDLIGKAAWQVAGKAITPPRDMPYLNIVSRTDRIVPHSTAAQAGERLDLDLGHVGMVVGGRARETLWEPLHTWLSRKASE